MKPTGLQNNMGEKAEIGYIIHPDKADREHEFPVFQQENIAFLLIYIFSRFHKKELSDKVIYK